MFHSLLAVSGAGTKYEDGDTPEVIEISDFLLAGHCIATFRFLNKRFGNLEKHEPGVSPHLGRAELRPNRSSLGSRKARGIN